MILLNFAHPITPEQQEQIEALTGQSISEIRGRLAQFDHDVPYAVQVIALMDQVDLSATEWQTEALLVNLPGFAPGAAIMVAEFHGRTGHFPSIIRIQPVEEGLITRYEVSEIINLSAVREVARLSRDGSTLQMSQL